MNLKNNLLKLTEVLLPKGPPMMLAQLLINSQTEQQLTSIMADVKIIVSVLLDDSRSIRLLTSKGLDSDTVKSIFNKL